jgi:2-hydroxy-4-carboxymuconate semialdehyde hemiacetal dehydrogenase
MIALRGRIEAGTERVHQVSGRFVIHRLENIGATGYHRSWTDNVLWHQLAHFVDFGAWMLGGTPRRVQSLMSPSDPRTGIPMDCTILVEMADGASMLTTGSFLGRERISETFVITDADSYRIDVPRAVMITGRETRPIAVEQQNCALAIRDFLDAVAHKRTPLITGASVLPAMRILQTVQDQWDERYGRQSLPGRPLSA